jgi:hypothetical protein
MKSLLLEGLVDRAELIGRTLSQSNGMLKMQSCDLLIKAYLSMILLEIYSPTFPLNSPKNNDIECVY